MSEKMYKICLSVPLGARDGKLYLRETNGKADGWLEVMNHRNPLNGTVSEDGNVVLYGEIGTLVDTVFYMATGRLSEKTIQLNLKTVSGIYSISGEEVLQYEEVL